MYSFYMIPLMVFEIEASNFKLSFYDFLRFAYDCINPPIFRILLCIFVKYGLTHRSCDAEENGLHVDGFALSHRLIRSDGNLKEDYFLIKNVLFELDEERSPLPEGFFFVNVRKSF